MTQIVLHVGAPKCGSNTLQTYWSTLPEPPPELALRLPELEDRAYAYAALIQGRLLSGHELRASAAARNLRYLVSEPPQRIAESNDTVIGNLKDELSDLGTS